MSTFLITLTEVQHRELMAILFHYSTRKDSLAISSDLKLAVAQAEKAGLWAGTPSND